MSLIKVTERQKGVEVTLEIDLTEFPRLANSSIPREMLRVVIEGSVRENLTKVAALTYSALHSGVPLGGAVFQLVNLGLRAAAQQALDLWARAEAGEDPLELLDEIRERGPELIRGSDSGDEPDLSAWEEGLKDLDLDL